MKIVSGGQTGVDRAALDVALSLGVASGGWCPAGRLDENGIIPAHYPVKELPGGGYPERTARNVSDADGTVIIHSGSLRGGTKTTADGCAEWGKPCLLIAASRVSPSQGAEQLAEFVRSRQIEILNVAGPRASEWPQGYDFAARTLAEFLNQTADGGARPKLSFVVPAHNEEHELPETLRVLRAAADAAREPYEVIVVDDASTDATIQIARESGARVILVNRRQIAAVRNAGARVARGEILFFVDADTRITPSHVSLGLKALADGCAGGSARLAVDSHLPFWARVFLRTFCAVYFAAGLGVGAFIFTRRESFETVGGFDEQYFAGEEVYLSRALKELGPFQILREPIVTSARKVRMHSPRFVLAQSFSLLLGGPGALRRREKLALWYDGKRESRLI
jgi:Circularly permutated YpsA SLOG family/Glycosyl transferase family 2